LDSAKIIKIGQHLTKLQ